MCGGGSVTIGRNCEIHPLAMILTYGGEIRIGDDCSLNPFSIVYGHGGVRIGNGVRIAAHTVVIPANHTPGDERQPLRLAPVTAQGVSRSRTTCGSVPGRASSTACTSGQTPSSVPAASSPAPCPQAQRWPECLPG